MVALRERMQDLQHMESAALLSGAYASLMLGDYAMAIKYAEDLLQEVVCLSVDAATTTAP